MQGKLFIISAPSGAGKTTLVHRVLCELENDVVLERVITYTTKEPRAGEQDGRDYHFVTKEKFNALLSQGFFMEHSKAYVEYYGSPSSLLEGLQSGISYLLIIDRVGAQEIIKRVPEAVLIWIMTPSMEILRQRLTLRGTESQEKIERRLAQAQKELDLEKDEPLYRYTIINDDLKKAVFELKGIICQEIAQKSAYFLEKEASQSDVFNNAS